MEEERSQCNICYGEYTTTGSHRMASLKCGHIFGLECIEKWISISKKSYCPSCSVPCKKAQIRIIYATKILAYDESKESELISKYIDEKEKRKSLENEVIALKAQNEILKMTLKNASEIKQTEEFKLHMRFLRFNKIHFHPESSLIEIDPINNVVLISCFARGSFGIFKYSIQDFSVSSFIKFKNRIKDMKLSPFKDGLLLVTAGSELFLLNVYTETAVLSHQFDTNVISVSFDSKIRDRCFVGDDKGIVYVFNLASRSFNSSIVSEYPILALCVCNEEIYACTNFEIFKVKMNSELQLESKKIDFEYGGIATNVHSDCRNVLVTIREPEFKTTYMLLGFKDLHFRPGTKQVYRHIDQIHDRFIYIVDDEKNSIKVLSTDSLLTVYLYSFNEDVVNFAISQKIFAVLTKKGVYSFDVN